MSCVHPSGKQSPRRPGRSVFFFVAVLVATGLWPVHFAASFTFGRTAHSAVATARTSTQSADSKVLGRALISLFSRFSLRLRCGFFPSARALLRFHRLFARGRRSFLFLTRSLLSRFFAFLPQLFFAQIGPKLFISKTAAQPNSSNCKCRCDLTDSLSRCHVPRTFV